MTIAGNQGQNVYPNPDNYPTSSFPQPVPVPSGEPDDIGTLITVQYSWQWQQPLLAAVDQLLNPYTWQGDHDAIINALDRAIILKDILQIDIGETVPAPYWDEESGDDADTSAPVNDQPWYGKLEGEDWVEYISWWIVGAFVATLVTPTGAIAFITPIRKLRIEFKKQNWGGIVRILLDGDTYAEVDTYSPVDAVGYVDVYSPGSDLIITWDGDVNPLATPNENGDFGITVIRKRFFEGEVVPTNLRYDDTTDEVQQTYDDGVTWVDQPGQDPRHATVFQFPPIVADDPRCQAAANMSKGIGDFLHGISGIVGTATNAESMLTVIIAGVAVFFPEGAAIGVLAFLALDFASTILAETFTAIDAAFTSTVYDTLTCIFYCHIASDGTVSTDQLSAILADINTLIGGLVYTVLSGYFFLVGEVGLTNMGAKGDAPADCGGCACGWAVEWIFGDSSDLCGLTLNNGSYVGTAYEGEFISSSQVSLVEFQTDALPEFRVTHLDFVYSMSAASNPNSEIRFRIFNGLTLLLDYITSPPPVGSHLSFVWDGDLTITQLVIDCGTGSAAGSTAKIEQMHFSGFGDPPAIGQPC